MKEENMLSGVNRLCRHCVKTCKQWEQVIVVHCPNYKNNGKSQSGGSQQAQRNA